MDSAILADFGFGSLFLLSMLAPLAGKLADLLPFSDASKRLKLGAKQFKAQQAAAAREKEAERTAVRLQRKHEKGRVRKSKEDIRAASFESRRQQVADQMAALILQGVGTRTPETRSGRPAPGPVAGRIGPSPTGVSGGVGSPESQAISALGQLPGDVSTGIIQNAASEPQSLASALRRGGFDMSSLLNLTEEDLV